MIIKHKNNINLTYFCNCKTNGTGAMWWSCSKESLFFTFQPWHSYLQHLIDMGWRFWKDLWKNYLEQKAKTFAFSFDLDGSFHNLSRSVLRWNTYIIQQWEYSSRPSREAGGTRDVSNVKSALARGTIRGCLGVPFLQIWQKFMNL